MNIEDTQEYTPVAVVDSLNAAVRSVFLHLTEDMAWPVDRVIVMGRSLGSGPAVRIAREFQPGVREVMGFCGIFYDGICFSRLRSGYCRSCEVFSFSVWKSLCHIFLGFWYVCEGVLLYSAARIAREFQSGVGGEVMH